jgi:hypothetical protein
MICAIHQPQYLPWLGYFDKMARADVFVFLDNVQFKKNEWQNRNRIVSSSDEGWQWLTVPVLHRFGQNINEVRLNPAVDWRERHRRTLAMSYARAPGFGPVMAALEPLYAREWATLSELNIAGVERIALMLGIKTRIMRASTMGIDSVKTRRLVDICRAAGCDTYLAGAWAEGYMDFDLFRSSGLALEIQQYAHPSYVQWPPGGDRGFISHLSAVDYLFCRGVGASGGK